MTIIFLIVCLPAIYLTGQVQEKFSHAPQLLMPEKFNEIPHVRDFAMSGDGEEIYFTVQDFKKNLAFIGMIQKEGDTWSDISLLPFSGTYNDIEPFISPDGERLYFSSNRPLHQDSIQPKDYDIWYVKKNNGLWTEPVNVGEPINSTSNEFYPAITTSGNLYFTAQYKASRGKEDIYVCRWDGEKYFKPENVGDSINTSLFEFNAYVSPDEKMIIYTSFGRNGSIGGGDLYYSTRDKNDEWRSSKMLPTPINSTSLDFCPFYDKESKFLYFTSDRSSTERSYKQRIDFTGFLEHCNTYPNGQSRVFKINIREIVPGME